MSAHSGLVRPPSLQMRRHLALEVINLVPLRPRGPNFGSFGYDVVETLGRGSSCTVRRALRRSDGRPVALKTTHTGREEMLSIAHGEYEILGRIVHPNILQAIDFFLEDGQATLVMELIDGDSLDKVVRAAPTQRLLEATSRSLALQLLGAFAYLHGLCILHRDVKPENGIVSPGLQRITLVDFNSACDASADELFSPTTLLYAAPEVVRGDRYTLAADVWGVAVCVFWMLSGHLPQGRDTGLVLVKDLVEVTSRLVQLKGKRWEGTSKDCQGFLLRCLALDGAARPTAAHALLDAWLARAPEEGDGGAAGVAR